MVVLAWAGAQTPPNIVERRPVGAIIAGRPDASRACHALVLTAQVRWYTITIP
jgi:hypothetical protein